MFIYKKQLFQIKITNQENLTINKTNIVILISYDIFYLTNFVLLLYIHCQKGFHPPICTFFKCNNHLIRKNISIISTKLYQLNIQEIFYKMIF